MDETSRQAFKQCISAAQDILIVSHVRPDGDAVGSVIAVGLALQQVGKQTQMILVDGVPKTFQYLQGSHQVQKTVLRPYDLSMVLDCSDMARSGVEFISGKPDINIDHHVTNQYFADLNLVDISAVATSAMLAELLPLSGCPMTPAIADALLQGVITDTLGFRTPNMTAKAFQIAAYLVERGGHLAEVYHKAFIQRSLEAARLWGAGLVGLQCDGKIAWTTLTLQDKQQVGYVGRDDADLINFMTTINGVDIYIVFVEQPEGDVKVSWRSQNDFDVSGIALAFGGGGHKNASGARVQGSLSEVQEKVLNMTRSLLQKGNNGCGE